MAEETNRGDAKNAEGNEGEALLLADNPRMQSMIDCRIRLAVTALGPEKLTSAVSSRLWGLWVKVKSTTAVPAAPWG